MATNRVTGVGLEVLNTGAVPNARVTNVGLEVLNTGAVPNAIVTSIAVEALVSVAGVVPVPVRSFGIIIF